MATTGRGGARPGAGRKPIREKFSGPVNKAEAAIAKMLPDATKTLEEQGTQRQETTSKIWRAAGTVTVQLPLKDKNGDVVLNNAGRPVTISQLVFPNHPPDEMVLIEERENDAPADVRATQYILDRMLGKPSQDVQPETPPGERMGTDFPSNGRNYDGSDS